MFSHFSMKTAQFFRHSLLKAHEGVLLNVFRTHKYRVLLLIQIRCHDLFCVLPYEWVTGCKFVLYVFQTSLSFGKQRVVINPCPEGLLGFRAKCAKVFQLDFFIHHNTVFAMQLNNKIQYVLSGGCIESSNCVYICAVLK